MAHFEEKILGPYASAVDRFIAGYFKKRIKHKGPAVERLRKSIEYSVLSGGKRFRPVLAMLTAKALGRDSKFVLPYACAVEFIHTYSLIHDDLPCMDNDNFRRGKPTNHKVFGEDVALLAGDALLTESSYLICEAYKKIPQRALQVVRELTQSAGLGGMVAGQSIDMLVKQDMLAQRDWVQRPHWDLAALENLHQLKTGELIKAAALGAAILCGASPKKQRDIKIYASKLGLAFQVKDDILDFNSAHPESASITSLIGMDKAQDYLHQLSQSARQAVSSWGTRAQILRLLVDYNENRTR